MEEGRRVPSLLMRSLRDALATLRETFAMKAKWSGLSVAAA